MSENDAELVSQSLSDSPGADDAFARLVARYRPAIYGLALAATCSVAEAEDLTQDTLIAAFLGLPQLRDPDRFGAWLKGIARNMLRMWYRRHAARPAFDGGHLLEEMDSGSQRLSPEEHVERQERMARIRQAVQDLSASNQQAIALRYWGEISYAEIGDTLKVPVSALKGNTFFATIHLTSDQGQYEIDARPSDAINIAVRTGAEVYVAPDVMEQASKIRHHHLPEELEPLQIPDWIFAQLCDEPEE